MQQAQVLILQENKRRDNREGQGNKRRESHLVEEKARESGWRSVAYIVSESFGTGIVCSIHSNTA